MITIVIAWRISRRKMKIPLLVPPRFFHKMSMGSLA
jgi:hypothetical protein